MKSRAIFAAAGGFGDWPSASGSTPLRPQPSFAVSVSATPNPYRSLDFAAAALGATSGPIAVLGGFAAVRRDGKGRSSSASLSRIPGRRRRAASSSISCLEGSRGRELATLQLDRHGEFTPGIDIHGWSSLGAWQDGVGHRGYGGNCTTLAQGVAAAPLLHAASVVFRVTRVEFADGAVWP